MLDVLARWLNVSIHAPGRGATGAANAAVNTYLRFNSRTREGCDEPVVAVSVSMRCFNSRTREGCDYILWRPPEERTVSIHAPGRGATDFWRGLGVLGYRFNSRTREGCDLVELGKIDAELWFQFTHPGGVRLRDRDTLRPSVGVSIHAPGRGATSTPLYASTILPSFNSRTREGCDRSS